MLDLLRQYWRRILLPLLLALVLLGHAARFYELPIVRQLDSWIYDARLRLTLPEGIDDRVVILDIDEKSLAALGRWPWSRDRLALLIDRLFDHYGIAALGFDVVFAEPDESSGIRTLEQLANGPLQHNPPYLAALEELRPQLDYDARLARAFENRPVVLGYYFSNFANAHRAGLLPAPVLPADTFANRHVTLHRWNSYGANLPQLQQAAALGGHFNPIVDDDGISRRAPMLVEFEGAYYESLSLALVRLLLGSPPVVPTFITEANNSYGGLEWLTLPLKTGQLTIPVDRTVSTLIPYRGKQGSFPYLPLVDVINGKIPLERLQGRIALVGTSTPSLLDLRATPVGPAYPGVEIHANLIAAMLDGKHKSQPAYMLGAEVAQGVFCALLLALALPLLSPLAATLISSGLLAAALGLNLWLWWAGLALPLATTLLTILVSYAASMAWGYFAESRSKRHFANLFGQYVPPRLVEAMARDPERYSMDGRNAELSVFFSDVRDFTRISESLSPKELGALMNQYLGAMTEIIRKERGTLDKYIGDAIMAFWGAPVDDAAHARQAVCAALEMQARLSALNAEFAARHWPALRIGIGINTGLMTVGDMGSPVRKAYTVLGDAVNLAARLEGLTKHYDLPILVGEATRAAAPDFIYREVDRVRVKGRQEAVVIYQPIADSTSLSDRLKESLRLWALVLRAYRQQQWDEAELQLLNYQRMQPGEAAATGKAPPADPLCALYAERIADLRRHPPDPAWDGITNFEVK